MFVDGQRLWSCQEKVFLCIHEAEECKEVVYGA